MPETTLFELGGFQDELEELPGIRVDVPTVRDLPQHIAERVLAEARQI
ncbi:MAG: hypothetical protein QM699_06380 [Amaricoccus sp.]